MGGREYNNIVERNDNGNIHKKILRYIAVIILTIILITTLAAVFIAVNSVIF